MIRPVEVFFDTKFFEWGRYGGIPRYTAYLYHHLHEHGVNVTMPLLFNSNHYLKGSVWPLSEQKLLRKIEKKANKAYYDIKVRGRYDLMHPTFDDHQRVPKGCPLVFTVHDMLHFRMPGAIHDKAMCERIAARQRREFARAVRLIAITEYTRRDLLDCCPEIDPARVEVIHHGLMTPPVAASAERVVEGDFLLFVGTRNKYKNFDWFIGEAAPIARRYGLRIMCTGGGPFGAAERETIRKAGAGDITLQGDVDDGQLRWLYENAACFVFPSLSEGFGLPVLEAFDAGCPQLLSHATCLPEIGGDAALYFDPRGEGSLAAALGRMLDDGALRGELVARGRERVKLFSPDTMVAKTAAFYRSALEG